jgi:hypothetical protein
MSTGCAGTIFADHEHFSLDDEAITAPATPRTALQIERGLKRGRVGVPLLARNGHADRIGECPFLGAKRKTFARMSFSGFDPEETLGAFR